MAMEINSIYGSYTGSYANSVNSRKQTTESMSGSKTDKTGTAGGTTETGSASRKTAADELTYLSGKFSNYSFVAANYTKGMQYGSSSTVNVAVSSQFLAKMASDPQLEKEYEENIAAMQKCDEQNARSAAAGGWHVVAQGWAIDKDGGISKWSIVEKDHTKSYLQKMSENAEEIREKNTQKKENQKEIEEKRQADREDKAELKENMKKAGKAWLGNQFKDAVVTVKDDENRAAFERKDGDNAIAAGLNLDRKA